MNLDFLKTLIVVAKHKSISRASEEIHLTPPAVTKQIRLLEMEYDIRIFEEKAKKRILTEDGKRLLDYAQRVVSLVNESKRAFTEKDRYVRGTLRIASNLAVGIYVLPKLVKLYSDVYPDLRIEMVIFNTASVIQAVKGNDVNFGFVGTRSNDDLITHHLFFRDRIHVVMDLAITKKALSWKQLQALPFIARERGSDIRDACDQWLKERNITLNTRMELNNTEAVKTCLHFGMGFSLLPYSTIERDVQTGYLRIVSAPHFNLVQNYYICHYKHKVFSKPERVFLDFLFQTIESGSAFLSPPGL